MHNEPLRYAARELLRSLARAVLSWNVDPENAVHNPVFMRDGVLNYYSPGSDTRETHLFLMRIGILGEGYNGAFRLTVPLSQIDEASDCAFDSGLEEEQIVEELIGFLWAVHTLIYTPDGAYPSVKIGEHPPLKSLYFPDSREEMVSVIRNLQILGYLRQVPREDTSVDYEWRSKALPLLKRRYMVRADQEA